MPAVQEPPSSLVFFYNPVSQVPLLRPKNDFPHASEGNPNSWHKIIIFHNPVSQIPLVTPNNDFPNASEGNPNSWHQIMIFHRPVRQIPLLTPNNDFPPVDLRQIPLLTPNKNFQQTFESNPTSDTKWWFSTTLWVKYHFWYQIMIFHRPVRHVPTPDTK